MTRFLVPALMLSSLAFSSSAAAAADKDCFVVTAETHPTLGEYSIAEYVGDRACVDFAEPRTYQGIWINEFEGSRYFDGARDLAEVAKMDDRVWFSFDEKTQWPGEARHELYRAYKVIFDGRQARDMKRPPLEGYGHFGMSPGLVLADRVVSIEDIGPAPHWEPGE